MAHGPFDPEDDQAGIEIPASDSAEAEVDITQRLLMEAGRTWETLSSDMEAFKAHR